MKKEDYAKWSTEKLLANVKLNKVAKAIVIGLCVICFSCFILLCGEIIEDYFWICVLVPFVIALYLWGMFALFNIELKRVKEELKKRHYSKRDEKAADRWLKRFYTVIIIFLVASIVIAVGAGLAKNDRRTVVPSESDESFSDYLKREDPELYNDIKDRYESLK